MAEILCSAEPAVAAAAAAGAGAVSEVVAVACEAPIVRATRRRRVEYARRYGGSVVAASDQHKRNRSQAGSHGDGGGGEGEEEDAKDRKLGAGGVGDETPEVRDNDEGGLLIDPSLQLLEQGPLPLNDCHAAAAAEAPRYGMASVRGRRRDMEDAVSIRPNFLAPFSNDEDDLKGFHFYGVFDGHGCSHVAISCKDRMHDLISQELKLQLQNPASAAVKDDDGGTPHDSRSLLDWASAMGRGFARMDSEVVLAGRSPGHLRCGCELQEASKCDHVGSTAVVAVVTGDSLVVANCGDSRAVMCRRGVPVPLSQDHKPDRPDELQRIQAAGGRVIYWDGARVLGVLAMSRAIGDNHLKPYVTSDPEVTVTARTDADEFLILASDGLWDVVSNATACQVVRMCFKGNGSRNNGTTNAGSATTATITANGINGVSSSPHPLPRVLAPDSEDADSEEAQGRGGGDCKSGSDKACLKAAALLTRLALARRSADNVSVVVVDLRRRRRRSRTTAAATTTATHR